MKHRVSLALGAALLAACGAAPRVATKQATTTASAPPPAPQAAPAHAVALLDPITVPHVEVQDLPSELHVSVAARETALVELRVVVASGTASDGAHPGLAEVAARLVGRTYAREAKADPRAPAALDLEIDGDSVSFRASVPPDGVAPTLAALGKAISKPAVDVESLRRAAAEVTERAGARGRSVESAPLRFAIRDLFLAPVGRHPYAVTAPTADEVRGIDDKSVRSYLETHYVARNVSLVAVGPMPLATLSAAAADAFAKVSVGPVAPLTLDPPDARPRPIKVMLIDEPKRDPVTLTVARLAPSMGDASASTTRLFGLVSRDRLVAKAGGEGSYTLVPFRGGPSVGFLSVRVSAGRVGEAVGYLRGEGAAWEKEPTADELARAKNEVTGELGRIVDSPATLAEALREAIAVGAPETILERQVFETSSAGGSDVALAARDALGKDAIVVAVGDASTIGEALTPLGEVDVLDPANGFSRVRSLSASQPPPAPAPPAPPAPNPPAH